MTDIQLIQPGANLSAATLNAPIQALAAEVERAQDIFEASFLGQSYYQRSVPLRNDVVVGMPVFFNSTTHQYEPGLAGATTNTYGQFVLSDSSDIVGIADSRFCR